MLFAVFGETIDSNIPELPIFTGTIPSMWKSAKIIPNFKGEGDRTDPNAYRPISLT